MIYSRAVRKACWRRTQTGCLARGTRLINLESKQYSTGKHENKQIEY
jgi:hypothetical protein